MNNQDWIDQHNFLYPRSAYRGSFTPSTLVFNANLQEFSLKIGYIASLHTSGKISTEEAYLQAKQLWKQLKQSKKAVLDVLKAETEGFED